MHVIPLLIAAAAVLGGATRASSQEFEVSVYGGWQTAPHSVVTGQHPVTGAFDQAVGWDGKSFAPPPYYGVRATHWTEDHGWALELTHAKVYAVEADRLAIGFDRMEFTDGHNVITANYMRRWPDRWDNGLLAGTTPYAGAGLGIALPHVDVQPVGGDHTFGYQLTGGAFRLLAGVSLPLGEKTSAFAEYQFTFSQNQVDLDGGGDLSANIVTNAVNIGLAYQF